MQKTAKVIIIGGGLAGCEAAYQCIQRNVPVDLFEMKPVRFSPAHESTNLAELVCSNSFRSNDVTSAVGLLKEEMRRCDSLIMKTALATEVPAGKALAVDRDLFSSNITRTIYENELVTVIRAEIEKIPDELDIPVIIATGPLTSESLAQELVQFTGENRLAFYDAIAPIVEADSLDMSIVYQKSRYDDGPGDYLNCPMEKEEYLRFIEELARAEYVPLKDFEDIKYFEGCLPIEVIRSRGDDTLRYGPMKPVGLEDPRTGKEAYAVVQLRKENKEGSTYNMVGFQTKLTYPEQQRIFRMIPGMQNARFARLGSIHRNTFVRSPELLLPTLQFQKQESLFLAGQLSGVEGYVESAAMGMLAGINAAMLARGKSPLVPPTNTALRALTDHLTKSDPRHFQPSNVNFGLFPPFEKKIRKKFRGEERARRSLAALEVWLSDLV